MKLDKMGVEGTALNWFRSYLSERSQVVDIKGNLSRSRKIKIQYQYFKGAFLGLFYFYVLSMTCIM
jgi:hypothetical protein